MPDAFIYDAVRTPRGRGKPDGALHEVSTLSLACTALGALRERNGLDAALVDDVILGCVDPVGEAGGDIARAAALASGYGAQVPGVQINRFCSSGLDAVNFAAAQIMSGQHDMAIGGGVESMSRLGIGASGGAWPMDPTIAVPSYFMPQGVSADLIATKYGLTRHECDAYAAASQARAANAWGEGRFSKSIVPVRDVNGLLILDRDEHMRPDTTTDALAALKPSFAMMAEQAGGLFETLARIRAEGRAILYISHKLEEVRAICERATILRHGKVIAACDPRAQSAAALARMMVGAEVGAARRQTGGSAGPVRLAVRGLSLPALDEHAVALKDVSFDVRAGEIVGVAGVAGNGQGELFDALSGETRAASAEAVALDGAAVGLLSPNERRRRSGAFVPEERLGHGTAPAMSLSDNAILSGHATNGFVRGGFIDRKAALAFVDRVATAFDVRKGPRDPAARALSGGNLQKFIVGRELLREPGVLVVAQPTWGVDAGAAQMIRQALVDRARAGAAVLVISQDLDELFEIADRIAVMFNGRLSSPAPASGLTREDVGLLMGGHAADHAREAVPCAS